MSDTYFLPGSVRNFNKTHQSADFEQKIFIDSWIQINDGLITYFKYFKYTVIVFALSCLMSFIGSSIWNCLEDNIVEKYTFEFKQKVLTSTLDNQPKKAKDKRQRTMNMFVKFFETFHHSSSYFYKYITVSIINLAIHIAIFIFYAWLLFDGFSDVLDPMKYLNLITLCLTDDLKQLRLDNIALLFPALYACQTKITGWSGTLQTINVTCCSYTNQRSAIYHVCALFFSLTMIFMYIGDTMMVLYTVGFLEYAKSGGSRKKMKKFRYMTFGKRMLFLLFENNTDTLFWNDFVINLTEELYTNEQNNRTNKVSETLSANEENKNFEDDLNAILII